MSVRATEASCLFVFAHDTKFMWQTFRENLNKILNNGQISYLFFSFRCCCCWQDKWERNRPYKCGGVLNVVYWKCTKRINVLGCRRIIIRYCTCRFWQLDYDYESKQVRRNKLNWENWVRVDLMKIETNRKRNECRRIEFEDEREKNQWTNKRNTRKGVFHILQKADRIMEPMTNISWFFFFFEILIWLEMPLHFYRLSLANTKNISKWTNVDS